IMGGRRPWLAMLAAGGTALYLSTALIGGFGYAYKATFLLLAVPLLSRLPGSRIRLVAGSGLAALLLVGVQSVVVWNTVLATSAGILAASFALGLALTVMVAAIRRSTPRSSLVPQS
ncbi:MAG TPA: hypothetical protein VIG24_00295, partial [Acidimicrobiia bacterium]